MPLYITTQTSESVRVIDDAGIINKEAGTYGSSGNTGDGGLATSAKFGTSVYVSRANAAGDVFVCDSGNHRVRKIDHTTGNISAYAGTGTNGYLGDGGAATSARLRQPSDIVWDSAGNAYISDFNSSTIRKVTVGGIISTICGTDFNNAFSGDGGAATAAKLGACINLAIDASDNLYISDRSNNRVRVINLTGVTHTVNNVSIGAGVIQTVAGDGTDAYGADGGAAISTHISHPNGIAVDGLGNLYITDNSQHVIRKVNSSGIISLFCGTIGVLGNTTSRLNTPLGVCADAAGNVWIADTNNHRVRVVTVGNPGFIGQTCGQGPGFAGDIGDGGLAVSIAQLNTPVSVTGSVPLSQPTTTVLVSTNGTTHAIGDAGFQLQATVTGSNSPSDQIVTFKEGVTTLGTNLMVGGVAALTLSNTYPLGVHTSIAAYYPGDSGNDPSDSSSSPLTLTVTQASPAVGLISDFSSRPFGDIFNLTATVTGGYIPTDQTITFKEGAATIGTGVMVGGVATLILSGLSVGVHSNITAVYPGDTNNFTETSSPLSLTVTQATPSVGLISDVSSLPYGGTFHLTATITGSGSPSDQTVTFKDGLSTVGTSLMVGGIATLDLSLLVAGGHSITAVYPGDTNNISVTSSPVSLTVTKIAPTSISLTSSDPTARPHALQAYMLTITLTGPTTPTGTVTFSANGQDIAVAVPLVSGAATIDMYLWNLTPVTFSATYSGDSNFDGA